MAVLVTGGAGYIGSHTVLQLVRRGEAVVVLDSMEYGNRAAIGDVPLVVGDIADRDLVARTISEHGVDADHPLRVQERRRGVDGTFPPLLRSNNVAKSSVLLDEACHGASSCSLQLVLRVRDAG
ncbi:MAG: NAD-dependent epimerase/dehydratase family protein [Ilumatobacteraceae bacterium]